MLRFLFVFLLVFLTSCERQPKQVVVTQQLVRRVDTTFQNQYKDSLQVELDSICAKDSERLYRELRDSLLFIGIQKYEKLFQE